MKKALFSALVLSALVIFNATPAHALVNLEGNYSATGVSPGSTEGYKGTVSIKKTNDTYHFDWTLGQDIYMGTGIIAGEYIAVAFTDKKGTWFGVMLYKISLDGKKLEGIWTGAGGTNIGKEVLVKN